MVNASEEQRMLDPQTKRIAESITLLAVARISMALSLPALGFVTWIGGQWLNGKFELQDQKITSQREASENQTRVTTARVETVEKTAQSAIDQASKVNDRLISVETKQTQDAASGEKFQAATLNRLDRVQDSIVGLSSAVAALTATLQTMADEKRKEHIGPN